MSEINILPKQVFQLIAAGEVVERPSSAIKEMIENSIDAGATVINVEIQNGGTTYLRITDNGTGIAHAEIPKVFLPHATSKIAKQDDLTSIATLGFRGEAMASIAAVARVELLSKIATATTGYRYAIAAGEETDFSQVGCPDGTTIVVRDLFFNTPARMKFLKKDVTESNAVAGVVDRIALSHPEISVRFVRDKKQVLLTSGDGDLLHTIYAVCGRVFATGLLPVQYDYHGVTVSGFISKPTECRSNRAMQYFFINGRLVQSRTCFAAIEQSYKNTIMVGKFPACVLNLHLDPAMVDVNVHPAKIEVRFVNEKPIFESVLYGCKSAIEQDGSHKEVVLQAEKTAVEDFFKKEAGPQQISFAPQSPKPRADFWQHATGGHPQPMAVTQEGVQAPPPWYNEGKSKENSEASFQKIVGAVQKELAKDDSTERCANIVNQVYTTAPSVEAKREERTVEKHLADSVQQVPPDFKLIGEAFKTYILIELEQELYFIDKHAAHERMLFEALQKQEAQGNQILMIPQTVRLSKEEYSKILQNLNLLSEAGLIVEDFGEGTVIIRECSSLLIETDLEDVITEIAGKLLSGKTDVLPEKMNWIYQSMACRAAVKAGDYTPEVEMQKFVEELLQMPNIRFCPHGRPVMIKMTRAMLEKQFGRA